MAAASTTGLTVGDENYLSQHTNGEETSQNGPRRWDRLMSVQEIHAGAGAWSLAGDAGLLQHLQEFSQRMISHTHQIGKEVDDLLHDAKLMDVRVNNVINDFIMLANNQFVENRVYDEDITEEPSTKEAQQIEQEKTKEQREAELIPRVSLALRLGVNVIDNAFEKLDPRVGDSDSEDEDNSYVTEPILEAKDPYVTRPLPFLIGTPQFMEDDNVGLVEELSDEESESDQGSISVSEDDKDSEESEVEYSTSEDSDDADRKKVAEGKKRAQTRSRTSSDLSEDSGKDMFPGKRTDRSSHDDSAHSGDISASDEDEPEDKGRPALPSGVPKGFNSELAARLGVAVPKQAAGQKESDEEDDWREKTAEHKGTEGSSHKHPKDVMKGQKVPEGKTGKSKDKHATYVNEDDDIFGRDDRQEDDDLFGKEGGLFSSSKGLFDDGDEGDLFGDVKKPAVKTQISKTKEDYLFAGDLEKQAIGGDDKKSISVSKPATSSIHMVKKPTAQPAGVSTKSGEEKGGGGLFDDNGDEDSDLFGSAAKKVDLVKKENPSSSKKITAPAGKKSDLFADEDDDEDLFGSLAAPVIKNKPHSNLGLTVEGYDEGEKVEERKLEDEQRKKKATPEKKLPAGAVSMFGKGPNPLLEVLKKQQQVASSSDEEENLSSTTEDRRSRTSSTHSTSSAASAPRVAEKPKNVDSRSSRNSSSSMGTREDDLFSPKPGSKPLTEKNSKINESSAKTHQEKSEKVKSSKDSLFDSGDDDDADIFSVAVKSGDSKRSGKQTSLFGDVGTTRADKDSHTKPTSQPANKKRGGFLFDEDDDDGEDEPLFSNRTPQTVGGTAATKNKTQGLFANDDLSLGLDDDPSVDLFSNKAALSEPSVKKETSKPSAASPPKKTTPSNRPPATNLFGGDDNDDDGDLFSVKPTKPSPAVTVVAETESSDAVKEADDIKPEVKAHKKLPGAVSMFGGVNPSAVLDKKKSAFNSDEEKETVKKDVKKEEKPLVQTKPSATTPISKPKPAADLFQDDDDDEDLFSPKAPVGVTTRKSVDLTEKEVNEAAKLDQMKPKKPAGAVSIFGAVEPSSFLKVEKPSSSTKTETVVASSGSIKTSAVVEPSDSLKAESAAEPTKEKQDESSGKKTLPPQKAPKPRAQAEKPDKSLRSNSLDLFGDDGEDADDLFAVTTKKATPPPTTPKSQISASTSPPVALKPERDFASPENVRPKNPVGGVSLYGGVDVFAASKKTPVSSEKAEASTLQKEKSASLPPFHDPLSVLTPPVTIATTQTKSKVEVDEKIDSSLENSLEKSLEFSMSSDFDHSVETLTSASKDRPKLSRRRPQSRKARILAATRTGIDFEDTSTAASTISGPLTSSSGATPHPSHVDNLRGCDEVLPRPEVISKSEKVQSKPVVRSKPELQPRPKEVLSKPEETQRKSEEDRSKPELQPKHAEVRPKTKSSDLFGNDDLFEQFSSSTEKSLSISGEHSSNDDGLFSNDLFHGKGSKLSNGAGDDLFSNLSSHEAIATTGSKITAKKSDVCGTVTANKLDRLEDLFSVPTDNSKAGDLPVVSQQSDLHPTPSPKAICKAKVTVPLIDDDLFSSSVKPSISKSKLPADKVTDDNLFSSIKPDDLFSSIIPISFKGDDSLRTEPGAANDFHENDIFGSSSLNRLKETKTKPEVVSAATGQDDFMDSKKSEVGKTTRPKKAVTKEANLLNDTTDIFTDVPTPTPRETKKKTPKKVAEKNVFQGDIDDIFADTSVVTIKPKKDARKKLPKSTPVVSDNIFDDPLS